MRRIIPIFLFLASNAPGQDSADLKSEVAELRALVLKLQTRVDQLEGRAQGPVASSVVAAPVPAPASEALAGTTVNLLLDGYYGYNFNAPIGRANLLRAYDVSSNSFSLNQAAVVIENAPDVARGKRFGARLDLQFGQATETLQGNPVNEPRPSVYRHVFQAYGTYVAPLGSGLTVDFGKFASSLGIEANYTKDQMNYSRSYWFNFLPFYHMGVRAAYKPRDWLSVNYWLVNGAQQTEDFNGYKDQYIGVTAQKKSVSWTVSYYHGQEHADTGLASGSKAPDGRLHIIDTYGTWQATPKLLLGAEVDYVVQRLFKNSPPAHTAGGALYARYQLLPRFAIAGRGEYLNDRGGMFSGATQALKEVTLTLEHRLGDGFAVKEEWRSDFSNRAYFLSDRPGLLKKQQSTATIGLVWWFGGKQGSW